MKQGALLVRSTAQGRLAFLLLVIGFAAFFGISFEQAMRRVDAHNAQEICYVNLKQIALGVLEYAQDHKNTLPDATRWVDETMPYIRSEAVFHDPAASDAQKWSYAFNEAYSKKDLTTLHHPASDVLLFESTLGVKNAHDRGETIPDPGRHGWHRSENGNFYAFVDGHVRWINDSAKPSLTGALATP